MRKQACGLILGLLLVTGCSSEDLLSEPSESPSQSSTTVVPTFPTRNSTIDEAYLKTVRDEIMSAQEMSDEQLIKTADSACAAAGAGESFFKVIDRVEEAGFKERDAAFIVGAAWAAYCPQHLGKLKS